MGKILTDQLKYNTHTSIKLSNSCITKKGPVKFWQIKPHPLKSSILYPIQHIVLYGILWKVKGTSRGSGDCNELLH